MSTTTDAPIIGDANAEPSALRRGVKLGLAACTVVLAWFVAVAVLTYFAEISPTVIVFGPESTTMAAMSRSDTAVLEGGPGFIIVQGKGRGFVRRLYSEGAWLVMPSNIDGCGIGGYVREKLRRAKT